MNRRQYEAELRREVDLAVSCETAIQLTRLWYGGHAFDPEATDGRFRLFGFMAGPPTEAGPPKKVADGYGCLTTIKSRTKGCGVAVTDELTLAILNDDRIPDSTDTLWNWLRAADSLEKKRRLLEPFVEFHLKLYDHYRPEGAVDESTTV